MPGVEQPRFAPDEAYAPRNRYSGAPIDFDRVPWTDWDHDTIIGSGVGSDRDSDPYGNLKQELEQGLRSTEIDRGFTQQDILGLEDGQCCPDIDLTVAQQTVGPVEVQVVYCTECEDVRESVVI
jgi:hypothetical protein